MRAVLLCAALLLMAACASAQGGFTVNVSLHGGSKPFKHFWKRCFGSGHASVALRADWQEQVREMREELGIERVRFHGIFDDDVTVVLDQANNFEFFNVDQIYGP